MKFNKYIHTSGYSKTNITVFTLRHFEKVQTVHFGIGLYQHIEQYSTKRYFINHNIYCIIRIISNIALGKDIMFLEPN